MQLIEEIFGFGKLQDFKTILSTLEDRGLSVSDLSSYVEKRKSKMPKSTTKIVLARKCECGANMMLMPLNTGPRDQTGDNSKSVWYCGGCHFEEFSEKTVGQQIQELSREGE